MNTDRARPSYLRPIADLALVATLLGAVAALMFAPKSPPTRIALPPTPIARVAPKPVPPRATIAPKPLDRAVIARAEAELDAASRDRALADHRAAVSAERLKQAELDAATIQDEVRSLGERVRDPRARLSSVQSRGAALASEFTKIETDLAAIEAAPRPKRKALIDKSPVAKPTTDDEYHFEVRRDRVAFIDLDRLIDKVKTDARIQLRLSGGTRMITSTVGPVGAFSMRYQMGRTVNDPLEPRNSSYDLLGWELVPARETRGETLDVINRPTSEFGRAINRLSPSSATVTLWVYPDGFPLYRRLRDMLHARGYTVAARPLPLGMPIKGSPGGSVSAAQ